MKSRKFLLAGAAVVGATWAAPAVAVQGVYPFVPGGCDVLPRTVLTDELGTLPPFPANEAIASTWDVVDHVACAPMWQPNGGPNVRVVITNLTPTTWTDLYFVADPGYGITNFDGTINAGLAFRIDTQAVNKPLVFESMIADEKFQPGETWVFIVQNWTPPPGVAWAPPVFGSIGVGMGSAPDPAGQFSTASIVANPVPEPGTLALLAAGLGALGAVARRRLGANRRS